MGVAADIQERAKSLRGTDTEGLLKKLIKEFHSFAEAELGYEKRRERRDLVAYRKATLGSNASVYNAQNISYNTQNISTTTAGGSASVGARKIITEDKEGTSKLREINKTIEAQTKAAEANSDRQVGTLVKAFVVSEALRFGFDKMQELLQGGKVSDAERTIHAIENVERAVRGESSKSLKERKGLIDVVKQMGRIYTKNPEKAFKILEGQTDKISGKFSGWFDTIKGVSEKAGIGNKAKGGAAAAGGIVGAFVDSFKAAAADSGVNKKVKSGGKGFAERIADVYASAMHSKFGKGDKAFHTGMFIFGDTSANVMSKAIQNPMKSFKAASTIFGATISQLINRPLYQTIPLMHQMLGPMGVGIALFAKAFKPFTMDLFGFFKKTEEENKKGFFGKLIDNITNRSEKLQKGRTAIEGFFGTVKKGFDEKKGIVGDYLGKKFGKGIKKSKKKIGSTMLKTALWIGLKGAAFMAIIGGIMTTGMAFLTTAWAVATTAFFAIMPFLPIILLGLAIVAIGVLIYKNWDKVEEHIINPVGKWFTGALESIKIGIDNVGKMWQENIIDPVVGWIENLVSWVSRAIDTGKQFFRDTFGDTIANALGMGEETMVETPETVNAKILRRSGADSFNQSKADNDRSTKAIVDAIRESKTVVSQSPPTNLENAYAFGIVQENN